MMDPNKLTMKSQAALEAARAQALARNQQAIEPEHVLFALLSDPEGVVYPLLHHLGVAPKPLRDRVDAALDRLPRVYAPGSEVRIGQATGALLDDAFREAEALTDEYVSTEHLLLALLGGHTAAAEILREDGLERDAVLAALAEVRGRQRVTDPNPEEKYQALERYGRDLTEQARARQARSGDRPRRRDPSHDPGAVASHEEQPGPDRRAWRGQDGDRRGFGPADRLRRCPGVAEGQTRGRA
jgi:ATP-dependent Clp protease ATP-binding subunit ClpB